ncbi:hypothetical protein J5N97_029586 [Dioscorea zingiberensis]|uniref:PIG-P domain-containing protein n=1 Tax=Dioscorea zingiberensis TaxID=325984 RepID=A0A9D5H3C5_9LILI|nr:hypothetical protein J5N97_029586 [Dioscorea zingiberensis]
MGSPPPSPSSQFVNSPRRTLSLVNKRRAKVSLSDPEEEKKTSLSGSSERGANPSEVYGFVGAITTVIATVIYLVWAYVPESWLHSVGITYYPNKYWVLAFPVFLTVTVVLMLVFYLGLNFMATPPPTSFNTMFDEHSREPSSSIVSRRLDQPIEPISDIGIDNTNKLMFHQI